MAKPRCKKTGCQADTLLQKSLYSITACTAAVPFPASAATSYSSLGFRLLMRQQFLHNVDQIERTESHGIPSQSPLYSSLRFLEADKDRAGVSSPTPPLAFSPIQCINESSCADVCGQHRAIFYTSNNFETGTSSTSAILNSVSIDTPKGQAYAVSVV